MRGKENTFQVVGDIFYALVAPQTDIVVSVLTSWKEHFHVTCQLSLASYAAGIRCETSDNQQQVQQGASLPVVRGQVQHASCGG